MNADLQLAKRLITIARTALQTIEPENATGEAYQAAASALGDLTMALDAIDRMDVPIAPPTPGWRTPVSDARRSGR